MKRVGMYQKVFLVFFSLLVLVVSSLVKAFETFSVRSQKVTERTVTVCELPANPKQANVHRYSSCSR